MAADLKDEKKGAEKSASLYRLRNKKITAESAQIAMNTNSGERQFEAKAGVVQYPFSEGSEVRDILVKEGWEDITEYPRTAPVATEPKKEVRYKKFVLQHPKHSDANRMNGNVALMVGSQEVSFEMKDGVVTIDAKSDINYLAALQLIDERFQVLKTEV